MSSELSEAQSLIAQAVGLLGPSAAECIWRPYILGHYTKAIWYKTTSAQSDKQLPTPVRLGDSICETMTVS